MFFQMWTSFGDVTYSFEASACGTWAADYLRNLHQVAPWPLLRHVILLAACYLVVSHLPIIVTHLFQEVNRFHVKTRFLIASQWKAPESSRAFYSPATINGKLCHAFRSPRLSPCAESTVLCLGKNSPRSKDDPHLKKGKCPIWLLYSQMESQPHMGFQSFLSPSLSPSCQELPQICHVPPPHKCLFLSTRERLRLPYSKRLPLCG